jgi:hypothetical protein
MNLRESVSEILAALAFVIQRPYLELFKKPEGRHRTDQVRRRADSFILVVSAKVSSSVAFALRPQSRWPRKGRWTSRLASPLRWIAFDS